jgi:hypothetical protein
MQPFIEGIRHVPMRRAVQSTAGIAAKLGLIEASKQRRVMDLA